MKNNLIERCSLFICLGSPFTSAFSQVVTNDRLCSFEKNLPVQLSGKGSVFTISDAHYKDGRHSLKWTFQPKGELLLKKDLQFEQRDSTGKDTYLSAFIVWVYNEKAIDKQITFQFLKDGKVCTSFPFGINFTGWRAAWVCYERDMEGKPQKGMKELRVVAPDTKGELYIDHLITAVKVDARQQAPDVQVPFVHKGTDNHWLVLYPHSLWKSDLPLQDLTEKGVRDMHLMEQRFQQMIYSRGKLTDKEISRIRQKYAFYGIQYVNGKVRGLPIFMVRQSEAYERMYPDWDKDMFTKLGMEMKEYFDLMKQIAVAYRNTSDPSVKQEMKEKFLAMYDHITDGSIFTITIPADKSVYSGDEHIRFIDKVEQTVSVDVADVHTLKAEPVFTPEDNSLLEETNNSTEKEHSVLLVEDNHELLGILKDLFQPYYKVYTAVDGKKGLAATFEYKPDLIISDIMMPEMSGTDMCLQIKNNIDLCHIPVILLTALNTMDQHIEGFNRGADEYISKPFNSRLLLARANNLVRNRLLIRHQLNKKPLSEIDLTSINPLDQEMLKKTSEILEAHLSDESFDIPTLCREIGMGRSLLYSKFKALTGMTPNNFLLNYRLKAAATLLQKYPDLPIIEVCERCGFGNPDYFRRCFKVQYNCTPQQYRREQHT